jgi:carbamoyltransferase
MNTIAVHLNHDSTISMCRDNEFSNVELERVHAKRHYDWRTESHNIDELVALVGNAGAPFESGVMVGGRDPDAEEFFRRLEIRQFRNVDHHAAHAAAAFYQSPFDRSLLISYDGGGNDGTFRTFIGRRGTGISSLGVDFPLNLGIPYRALANPIADIRKPDDGKERTNAGKLMGLAAYGAVRPEWIGPVTSYFQVCSTFAMTGTMYLRMIDQLQVLGPQIGLCLARDALCGGDACDLARTSQHVFEALFLERVLRLVKKHNLPICLSGGCALNVLMNQRLAEITGLPMFVPPNPNDCGLALGALLFVANPEDKADITYSGVRPLDLHELPARVTEFGARPVSAPDVAALLSKGAVVAVMRGNSEHGPRALGHRSILCDPAIKSMKDRLNRCVKFRESFRPYAPVVRAKDACLYFENIGHNDLSFMSFNPTVRLVWRETFASAMHVDGTARVQTVTEEQNPWLTALLNEFAKLKGYGALLNTSFNIKGQPMVARISDALAVFQSTDIDFLVIEDWLFSKPQGTLK